MLVALSETKQRDDCSEQGFGRYYGWSHFCFCPLYHSLRVKYFVTILEMFESSAGSAHAGRT